MARAVDDEDFILHVDEVFPITGRGVVATGVLRSGSLRNGDQVDVWQDGRLITTASARIEFTCRRTADPRTIALLFADVAPDDLRAGQVIRRSAK
jgi:GTPase